MKTVGIIGTDGIPNRHGGFERLAEHLALALKDAGYRVVVYNSREHPYPHASWHGVEIVKKTTLQRWLGSGSLFIYDLFCLLDARKRRMDVVIQLGYTTSAILQWLLPAQTTLLTNMDGFEWMRSKYGSLTKSYLHFAEGLAVRGADSIIADHPVIAAHIRKTYNRESTYIPYGAHIPDSSDVNVPARYDLDAYQYLLLVARMQPDNHIEEVIRGYLAAGTALPLVIAGSTGNRFGRKMKIRYNQPAIRFLEGIYDKHELDSLRHFSGLQFHGHSAGGTNPSLLEAMAAGRPICAHDNPFNRYVLGHNAWFFSDEKNVASVIHTWLQGGDRQDWTVQNRERIRIEYTWQAVTEQYIRLLTS